MPAYIPLKKKKDYLAELSVQLELVARAGQKIIFYKNNFPAGYLVSSRRSALNVSFLVSPEYYTGEVRESVIDYLRNQLENESVVAVKVERLLLWEYTSRKTSESDFISRTIAESKPEKIAASKNFQIYQLNQED